MRDRGIKLSAQHENFIRRSSFNGTQLHVHFMYLNFFTDTSSFVTRPLPSRQTLQKYKTNDRRRQQHCCTHFSCYPDCKTNTNGNSPSPLYLLAQNRAPFGRKAINKTSPSTTPLVNYEKTAVSFHATSRSLRCDSLISRYQCPSPIGSRLQYAIS